MSWAESLPVFGSTYASGFGLCASLIVAIGASIDIVLIAAGVAGMGALMTRMPALLVVVKYVGALFVFLYGLRALYSAWKGPGYLDAIGSRRCAVGGWHGRHDRRIIAA